MWHFGQGWIQLLEQWHDSGPVDHGKRTLAVEVAIRENFGRELVYLFLLGDQFFAMVAEGVKYAVSDTQYIAMDNIASAQVKETKKDIPVFDVIPASKGTIQHHVQRRRPGNERRTISRGLLPAEVSRKVFFQGGPGSAVDAVGAMLL